MLFEVTPRVPCAAATASPETFSQPSPNWSRSGGVRRQRRRCGEPVALPIDCIQDPELHERLTPASIGRATTGEATQMLPSLDELNPERCPRRRGQHANARLAGVGAQQRSRA